MNEHGKRMRGLLRTMTLTVLIASSTGLLTACRTVVIPSDEVVVRMPAGTNYTAEVDGWFVPDARMQKILDALDRK